MSLDPFNIVIIMIIVFSVFHIFQMAEDNLSAFTAARGPGITRFNSKAISKHWTQFVSD